LNTQTKSRVTYLYHSLFIGVTSSPTNRNFLRQKRNAAANISVYIEWVASIRKGWRHALFNA